MRLQDFGISASIALQLLYAAAGFAHAQQRSIPVAAWVTVGMGAANFPDARVEDPFPPTLAEGWLAVGPLALGVRRLEAGAGINTTERLEKSWLVGAHTTYGPLMLVAGAGQASLSGRNSNGEQSGTTTPIEQGRGWTAEGELSCTLGHYFGFGVARYRTGGTKARSSGTFVVVQVGRLR